MTTTGWDPAPSCFAARVVAHLHNTMLLNGLLGVFRHDILLLRLRVRLNRYMTLICGRIRKIHGMKEDSAILALALLSLLLLGDTLIENGLTWIRLFLGLASADLEAQCLVLNEFLCDGVLCRMNSVQCWKLRVLFYVYEKVHRILLGRLPLELVLKAYAESIG